MHDSDLDALAVDVQGDALWDAADLAIVRERMADGQKTVPLDDVLLMDPPETSG